MTEKFDATRKAEYSLIQEKHAEHPVRRLISVVGDRNFIASLSAFGPGTYRNNQAEMQKQYSHPETGKTISFKPATTAETILINAYDFENIAKKEIFDPRWLQLGIIVKISEGFFANVPRDAQGKLITDEKTLKSFLKTSKKVNEIYLLGNDFGFAPYETLKRGIQEGGTFAEGGLARLLEHSDERTVPNLGEISSSKNYSRGVNVYKFDETSEPLLRVSTLNSGWDLDRELLVDGNDHGSYRNGYAFGVQVVPQAHPKTNIY